MINETEALGRLPDEPRSGPIYVVFIVAMNIICPLVFYKRLRLIHGSDTTAFYWDGRASGDAMGEIFRDSTRG